MQKGRARQWGIVQKQTGADRLTLGGALGANIHGRGLKLRPFIGDVEAFSLGGRNPFGLIISTRKSGSN